MIGLYRNGILFAAILGLLVVLFSKGEAWLTKHDSLVSRDATQSTITKIETANADAAKAGIQAAKKSRGEIVEVPSIWPYAVWSAPAGVPARRVRKPQAGATVDPTSHDD